ncbi:hypothetical protein A4G19_03870 [Pasteurellaceae bacterium Macca]|nr:hypothetical protein [Pasteurellaceae bacterium Macca]
MKGKFLLLANFALILTACTTTPQQCDPSKQLGMLDKLSCTMSHSYDQRITDKEQDIAYEQQRNAHAQADYAKTQSQQSALNKTISQKQAQQQKISQNTKALQQQVGKKQQQKQATMQEIKRIEKQISAVKSSGKSAAQQQSEIKALESRLEKLRDLANDL